MKKGLSIAIAIVGIVVFFYGNNMASQTAFEEGSMTQTEMAGRRRPIVGPARRSMRAEAAESNQQMWGAKRQEMGASQVSANWLRGAGAVLVIIGIGSLFFCRKARN